MEEFNRVLEEIYETMDLKQPSIDGNGYKKLNNVTPIKSSTGQKRNENNQGKIAGKYFKGMDNTSGKMVSDQDKKRNTAKGQLKRTMDQSTIGYSKIMSQKSFDRLFNNAGERSIQFSDDGKWKSLNSKTTQYQARKLSDGRIKVRKLRGNEKSSPPN